MKKTKLIIFIVSLIMVVALLVIGIVFAGTDTIQSGGDPITEPPATIEPNNTPQLDIPDGTYYYVLGTHTAYAGAIKDIEFLANAYPKWTINGNQYEVYTENGSQISGTAHRTSEVLTFDTPEQVQEAFQISVEHDSYWHGIYYPKQEKEWQCTYDEETKRIVIAHNSDFVEFQYFASTEEYVEYIKENFTMSNGEYFEIYPTPHAPSDEWLEENPPELPENPEVIP